MGSVRRLHVIGVSDIQDLRIKGHLMLASKRPAAHGLAWSLLLEDLSVYIYIYIHTLSKCPLLLMVCLSNQKNMLLSSWIKEILIPSPLVSGGHLLFCPESKGLCLLPYRISQTINNMAGGGWDGRQVYCTVDCINEAFTLGTAGITWRDEPLSHTSSCYRPHCTNFQLQFNLWTIYMFTKLIQWNMK